LSEQTKQLYEIKIELPFGSLGPLMEWCKQNCSDTWFFSDNSDFAGQGNYKFYFESEKDYVNFMLFKK
jgi:hypothetical protein